jgi:endothelin-converting enzyme/putative endopeptidase
MRTAALALVLAGSLLGSTSFLAAQTGPKAEIGSWGVDLNGLSKAARPGDDFYGFVNEGWSRTATIPAGMPAYDDFVRLYLSNQQRVDGIIKELLATRQPPGSSEQQIADLYRSASDRARLNRLGLQPIRKDLADIAAIRSHEDVARNFALPWQSAPIDAGVLNDPGDPARYIASIGQGGLTIAGADYYLRDGQPYETIRAALRDYIGAALKRANIADPETKAVRIIELETAIARLHWTPAQQRDPVKMYKPMTIAELERFAPGFAWKPYLAARGYDRVNRVNVMTSTAVQGLAHLVAATPVAVWRDYLTFHTLDTWSTNLDDQWQQANFDFHKKLLQGIQQRRPPEAEATEVVSAFLAEPVGRIYVRKYFPAAYRAQVDEMVGFIRAAFQRRITGAAWMDDPTRQEALAKLAKVTSHIGYPERWRDLSSIDIRPDDYVGNVKRCLEWQRADARQMLEEPRRQWQWVYPPQEINAGYSASMNSITFPAGILQPPFFDPSADAAVNFGSIAAVIGHEFGHAFDDQGSRSDGEGRLRDWWTPAARAEFDRRTAGLVEQFGQYEPVPGTRINGRQNLGENIGDLGGLTIAYEAYRQYVTAKQGGTAPVIDGYSGDQRFFMAWAQLWRSIASPEQLRRRTLTDPHSAGPFRANGVVRNMDAWYEAFGVKPGDKLYLPKEQRVRIW